MTDRELLEMAAKAANAEFEVSDEDGVYLHQPIGGVAGFWNPLTDDGDALRLAVVLSIRLAEFKDTVVKSRGVAWKDGHASCALWEPEGTDPYAATRRAIVRAAAAIGKAMP